MPLLDPVAPDHARRFMRRAQLLNTTALPHHSFIQIDPVNVRGRATDPNLDKRPADR